MCKNLSQPMYLSSCNLFSCVPIAKLLQLTETVYLNSCITFQGTTVCRLPSLCCVADRTNHLFTIDLSHLVQLPPFFFSGDHSQEVKLYWFAAQTRPPTCPITPTFKLKILTKVYDRIIPFLCLTLSFAPLKKIETIFLNN